MDEQGGLINEILKERFGIFDEAKITYTQMGSFGQLLYDGELIGYFMQDEENGHYFKDRGQWK